MYLLSPLVLSTDDSSSVYPTIFIFARLPVCPVVATFSTPTAIFLILNLLQNIMYEIIFLRILKNKCIENIENGFYLLATAK